MSRVGSAAGRPKNQGLDSFEKFEPIRIDCLAVAQVGCNGASALTKQKTEHMGAPVLHLNRMDFRTAKQKGTLNQMRFREHVPGKSRCSVECIGETFFQALHGFPGRVDGNRTTVR